MSHPFDFFASEFLKNKKQRVMTHCFCHPEYDELLRHESIRNRFIAALTEVLNQSSGG
jgi:hypothetical protein